MIELDNKIILDSGKVLVTEEKMASLIVEGKPVPEHYKVLPSHDAEVYKMLYRTDLSLSDEDFEPLHVKITQTESDIDQLYSLLLQSDRFNETEIEIDRIEHEMDFFISNNLVPFILKLNGLIERFKNDNVVWGVGRGSSCASYTLYLLEIHDIDSLRFDINFREFSKTD